MGITHTRTFAILELPDDIYTLVRSKLLASGYDQAIETRGDVELIDMQGIALQAEPKPLPKPPEHVCGMYCECWRNR